MVFLKTYAIAILAVAGAIVSVARAAPPEAVVSPLMTKGLDDQARKP